ncbi:MAG: Glu/Leu/Phe/Val dehydrogenase dimerization domain-containing protein [Myxococcota bacterium]|nr:Glu/Leu/Phe/Val dehydrogenase dimerization domain-containing protein [Myxococcota bacterium]
MSLHSQKLPGPDAAPVKIHAVDLEDSDVQGWLVVDTVVDGMAFGGFRISPAVDQEEVAGLARAMTWKLAGHGLPVGGAKGGLRADPTDPETPARLKRFSEACRELLTSVAVVGKDMGATDPLIDGIYEQLDVPQLHVARSRGDATSVPDRLRDLTGYRRHMTGLGVAWAVRAAMGGDVRGRRVAIQGCGLVGIGTAIRLHNMGARVVAISDAGGGVVEPTGLSVDALVDPAAPKGQIPPGLQGERVARDHLFEIDSDVLVLAASSNSVGVKVAESARAPLVVEGSNFGLTAEAREVLHRRGIAVVPDLIASSSSAAMVARQLASRNTLSPDQLWEAIEGSITRNTRETLARTRETGQDSRVTYLQLIGATD